MARRYRCRDRLRQQIRKHEAKRRPTVQLGPRPFFRVDDWPATVMYYANCMGL